MELDPTRRNAHGEGRRGYVGIRLSTEERRAVEAAAAVAGCSMSRFVRVAVVEACKAQASRRGAKRKAA